MELSFLHPRTSMAFKAQVEPSTTGETCIRGLINAQFVDDPPPGRPYSLIVSRTQQQILPSASMQDAGVMPGDVVSVAQNEQGAAWSAGLGRRSLTY